jgi:hypothetical protein
MLRFLFGCPDDSDRGAANKMRGFFPFDKLRVRMTTLDLLQ